MANTDLARERRLATSVLVIGTGGAGLRAAIQLAERGTDVLLVGKRPSGDAHTTLAAGGINAALGTGRGRSSTSRSPRRPWRSQR